MQLSCKDFSEALRKACSADRAEFRIVYHISPDGDCICSAYALLLILRALGAKAAVCGADPVPQQFRDLTDGIVSDKVSDEAQYIGVDCKDRGRTDHSEAGRNDLLCNRKYAFWIDHHGSPEEQAPCEFVRPESAACSELILQIAETLRVTVTPQIAELLFTALITDTFCFRTIATNAETFVSASKLAAYGANAYAIARKHAMVKSQKRLALEQRILSEMHLLCGDRLVTCMIRLEDLAAAGIRDTEAPEMQNINNLPELIETALITVMIREYPGRTRFSVKTTSPALSAKAIAERFGGGGHVGAAGGYLSEPPETVRQKLEEYCTRILSDSGL